jgi:hypothetical protein
VTETREVHDFTHLEPPRISRWDRGDGAGAIRTLVDALDRAGLPGQLQASLRLLDQAEALGDLARRGKDAARERLDQATTALVAGGPVDVDAYAATLVETSAWLDDTDVQAGRAAAAMAGLMNAVQRTNANAVQVAMAEASGIYQRLQGICADVVAEIAAVPPLPARVWSAATSGQAGEAAIQAGHELGWSTLVKAGGRFDSVHAAGALLRETGGFAAELNFPGGCPTRIGVMFLNWEAAAQDLAQVQRLPGPLRVKAAADRQWAPGLYLASDHVRAAAEAPKKRGLAAVAAGWVGR